MKKEEVAWILPGGGNQTAYTCGVILALMKLDIGPPKFILAASGGAANAFYFLAEQMERAKKIWTTEISTKKILNPLRFWKIFNRDAMIDGVFMKEPGELNLKRVENSPIKCLISVTEKDSGEPIFISNKENIDLLNLLKATMSVPFFSGIFKSDSILINDKEYTDSRISGRYELLLKKAIDLGAKRMLIFGGNTSWNYRYGGNLWYNLFLYTKNKEYRLNQKELEHEQKSFQLPSDISCFFLCLKHKMHLAPWENKKWQLREAVNRGYFNTLNRSKELKMFLKS